MSKETTYDYYVAQAIQNVWDRGKPECLIREVTAELFKDMPVSPPLVKIVRDHVGGALRVLSALGRLGHPVTAYFFKLPVRQGARLVPLDTVNRRKCVPLSAGPKGTYGVRMVATKDDPLFLEALGQLKVMMAGGVKDFERKQEEAADTGLLSRLIADVRDPNWFEQALLEANPQPALPTATEADHAD